MVFMGKPQSGWVNIGANRLNRIDFLHKLTTAKAKMEKVTLIPGETTELFLDALSKELKLDRKKLGIYYKEFTHYPEAAIFSDTYYVPYGITEKHLIYFLLTESEKRYEKISKKIYGNYRKKKWLEVLTIASIIQKEAANTKEMPVVSSVIYNRLKNNILVEKHKELTVLKDSFNNAFVTHLCHTIHQAVSSGKRQIELLNKELQHHKFGADQESFRFDSKWMPEYREYARFFEEIINQPTLADDVDLFDMPLSEKSEKVRAQLMAMLLDEDETTAATFTAGNTYSIYVLTPSSTTGNTYGPFMGYSEGWDLSLTDEVTSFKYRGNGPLKKKFTDLKEREGTLSGGVINWIHPDLLQMIFNATQYWTGTLQGATLNPIMSVGCHMNFTNGLLIATNCTGA